MEIKVIIGIDLAAKQENPTGGAIWKGKIVETDLPYADEQILEGVVQKNLG